MERQATQAHARTARIRNLVVFAVLASVLGVLLWLGIARRTSRAVPLIYVACAGNNHVQVIDLASGRTLRKIYAGIAPWRLVASPDKKRLWVQHWYSGTTTVVGLDDHEIIGVISSRGPGAFTARGDQFLTFDWPSSTLLKVDPQSLATITEQSTEVRKVYDVAPDPDGQTLYLAQFDPMAKGQHERYGYVLGYPLGESDPAKVVPVSRRTGKSPIHVRTAGGGAFTISADHETNGLSLINKLGDGRAVPSCPSPHAITLSADETSMVVACWSGDGSPKSQIVSYRTNFQQRPWPAIAEEASVTIVGGLVAASFSPSGDRVYVVDRTGNRLLELDAKTLGSLREFPTGDVPLDVVVIDVPPAARDRLNSEEGRSRVLLKKALALLQQRSRPVSDLSWTETTRPSAAEGANDAPQEGADVEALEGVRHLRAFLKAPDSLRFELEDGSFRLAQGGHAVSLDAQGRFWVAPRQDLAGALFGLSNLSVDDAVRRLAGDVAHSPYLRGGVAVDLIREIREADDHYYLIGASKPGERVSQLWVDARTGRATNLVEQFPTFEAAGHGSRAFGGIVETKFEQFAVVGGVEFPTRLQRIVDGRRKQEVRIEGLVVNSALDATKFDVTRLGGATPGHEAQPLAADASGRRESDEPGHPVAVMPATFLSRPQEPHAGYTTSPPTSGPVLPYLADWGIHRVPVPLELQVHNLEHGGVAIQYNCPEGCPDLVAKLEGMARGREFVLVAPFPLMSKRIALTAWGRVDTLDELDSPRIQRFIESYAGKDHSSDVKHLSGAR